MHRSRVCHFVIDVSDLDQGVAFWSAALGAAEEPVPETSSSIYRHRRLLVGVAGVTVGAAGGEAGPHAP